MVTLKLTNTFFFLVLQVENSSNYYNSSNCIKFSNATIGIIPGYYFIIIRVIYMYIYKSTIPKSKILLKSAALSISNLPITGDR